MFRLRSCLAVFLVRACIRCDVRQTWAETIADSGGNNLDAFVPGNAVQSVILKACCKSTPQVWVGIP